MSKFHPTKTPQQRTRPQTLEEFIQYGHIEHFEKKKTPGIDKVGMGLDYDMMVTLKPKGAGKPNYTAFSFGKYFYLNKLSFKTMLLAILDPEKKGRGVPVIFFDNEIFKTHQNNKTLKLSKEEHMMGFSDLGAAIKLAEHYGFATDAIPAGKMVCLKFAVVPYPIQDQKNVFKLDKISGEVIFPNKSSKK